MSRKPIKCVIWDLDNTIWDGVLLEDDRVTPRPGVVETIRILDERGILHSVASRNDHDAAIDALRRHDLLDYFLAPQINWGPKSASVRAIAGALNLGVDSFAFIDDQRFERDEVAFELPEVLCIDAADVARLADRPELTPAFVTEDSRRRRQMYRADEARSVSESSFDGPAEAFLSTLDMKLTIRPAVENDLRRAEELTVRTNQLNTTGYTYSYDELAKMIESDQHRVFVASLDDRYGPYGTIGLVLLETAEVWTVKLFLMSCRVMSRGVGTVMITFLRQLAQRHGVRLQGEFLPNGRNRAMLVTYRFNGFREISREGELARLEADLTSIPPYPSYMRVSA